MVATDHPNAMKENVDNNIKKKPTLKQLRGEIMTTLKQLRENWEDETDPVIGSRTQFARRPKIVKNDLEFHIKGRKMARDEINQLKSSGETFDSSHPAMIKYRHHDYMVKRLGGE